MHRESILSAVHAGKTFAEKVAVENMKPMWPDMAILSNQPEVEKYGRHTVEHVEKSRRRWRVRRVCLHYCQMSFLEEASND